MPLQRTSDPLMLLTSGRGSALDSLGQFDSAIADYTRALELDTLVGGGAQRDSPSQTDVLN